MPCPGPQPASSEPWADPSAGQRRRTPHSAVPFPALLSSPAAVISCIVSPLRARAACVRSQPLPRSRWMSAEALGWARPRPDRTAAPESGCLSLFSSQSSQGPCSLASSQLHSGASWCLHEGTELKQRGQLFSHIHEIREGLSSFLFGLHWLQ